MTDHVAITDEGATRVIAMRRPEKKNALTPDMYNAMSEAIVTAQGDSRIRCLIMSGIPGAFTAGNDLTEFLAIGASGGAPDLNSAGAGAFLRALTINEKPLVAAVDGLAIGIGTTLMFHCDYVVASKTSVFATPFVGLGLVPEAASSLLAPMLLGHQRAFSLLVMGRRMSAEDGRAAGFVSEVVDSSEVDAAARKAAGEIAALPVEAVAISRKLMRLSATEIGERMDVEGKHFGERLKSDEAIAAFQAFMARKK
jgi:enoyl-CoA hydratase/carnithine racemase